MYSLPSTSQTCDPSPRAKKRGRAAYAAERAYGRVDAAGNRLLRPGKQRFRLRNVHTRVWPRISLRNRKLIKISCTVVLTLRSSRFFSSK